LNRPFFHLPLLHLCGLAAVFGGMIFLSSPGIGVLCGAAFTTLLYLAYGYAFRVRLGAESEAVLLLSLGFCLLMATGGLFDLMDWSFIGPGGDARSGYAIGGVVASLMLAFLINRRIQRIPASMALTAVIAMVAFACLPNTTNILLFITDDFSWMTGMAFLSIAVLTLPFLLGNRPLSPLARICVLEAAAISPYIILQNEGNFISACLLVLLNGSILARSVKKVWHGSTAIALFALTCSLNVLYGNASKPGWEVPLILMLFVIITAVICFWIAKRFREITFFPFLILTLTIFMIPLDILPQALHSTIPFINATFFCLIAMLIIYASIGLRRKGTILALTKSLRKPLSFSVFCRRAGVVIMVLALFLSYARIITSTIIHEGPTRIVAGFMGDKGWISESLFIKLAMKDEYLWQDKIRITGVADADPDELLYKLRYKPQDRGYSFTSTLKEDEEKNNGVKYDRIGISMTVIGTRTFIKNVYNNSPAGKAGLMRGFEIMELNHKTSEEIERLKLREEIAKNLRAGKELHLRVKDMQGVMRDLSVEKGTFQQDPPLDRIFEQNGRKVGYLFFWSFNSQQETELEKIFSRFEKEGIDDLILDLRYNGGGRVEIARRLASRITGKVTKGKVFTRCIYNARYRDLNSDYFFMEAGRGLNLQRLVVLTSEDTASSSELIINGLRPYIPVITIGERTAGKDVGQNVIAYGGKALHLVSFRCYNARNEGNYFHGIPPDYRVPDDLTHPLGSPEEGMTKAALEYLGRGF
jgi:C-terminal processing protease CtpA/Prc